MNKQYLVSKWVLLVTLVLPFVAAAQDVHNIALVEEFVMPAYQEMLVANQSLDDATQRFCANLTEVRFEDLREAFNVAMDANQYAGIARFRHASSSYFWQRLNYYPDLRGKTPDQLQRLLKSADPQALEVDRFSKSSYALQGLGAFEILVFGKDSTPLTFTNEAGQASYSCQVMRAISKTILANTKRMLAGWTVGPLNFRVQIRNPSKGMRQYSSNENVVVDVVTDLHAALYRIGMIKMGRPAGRLEKGQPAREENWRSKRWLRNIRFNLDAADQLFTLGLKPRFLPLPEGRQLSDSSEVLFKQAHALIGELESKPDQDFASLAQTDVFAELQSTTLELDVLIAKNIADALTTEFGFNFDDGD